MLLRIIILNIITINLIFGDDPPKKWKETWYEHVQMLDRVYFDDEVAIYFDKDVNKSITWPFKFLHDAWAYTKRVYGSFGEDKRLYVIFHTGRLPGCHKSTYFEKSHEFRNAIDCGRLDLNGWNTDSDKAWFLYNIYHIIEAANNGVHEHPSPTIYRDTLAQIFVYDVYIVLNLGNYQNYFSSIHKNYPRANSYWFRDWFYPIYTNYGGAKVINEFFVLLSKYFPKDKGATNSRPQYTRNLNYGEFFHFWSGAANSNLKDLAIKAFCWNQTYENEFQKAQIDFSNITY